MGSILIDRVIIQTKSDALDQCAHCSPGGMVTSRCIKPHLLLMKVVVMTGTGLPLELSKLGYVPWADTADMTTYYSRRNWVHANYEIAELISSSFPLITILMKYDCWAELLWMRRILIFHFSPIDCRSITYLLRIPFRTFGISFPPTSTLFNAAPPKNYCVKKLWISIAFVICFWSSQISEVSLPHIPLSFVSYSPTHWRW